MRIVTTDQNERTVLDFHRCAMLPARGAVEGAETGIMEPADADLRPSSLAAAFAGWNLAAFRSAVAGPHFTGVESGSIQQIAGGDVVTSAPELARLTLNLAAVHHDRSAAGGKRLVYGGHTIGIAAAQINRAFPALVTIVGWRSCDHTGPVHEGDTLYTEVSVEDCVALPGGGGLVHLRARVSATPESSETMSDVLDWRLVALFA